VCLVGGILGPNQAKGMPAGGPELKALPITDGGNIGTTKKSRSSWTKSRCRYSSLSILNSSKVVLHIIQNPILRGDQPNKPVPLLTGTTIFAHARPL